MDRRKFLGLSIATMALTPMAINAIDFRKEKPDAWTAKTVDDAIKALYGDIKPADSDKIKIKAPKVASNGGSIPIGVKTDIDAKSIALFQNVNPESAVIVWTVPENGIADYSVKIKMKTSGKVTVVVEGKDGKFYTASKDMEVALGGCEG
jgi:sulfur-oxidizing protein SoxY